jgi:hypothetical protein
MPSYCNGGGGPATPTSMTGASLSQRRRGWNALERAAFAAFWIEGKVVVTELTAQAIIAMVGANARYTYAMRRISDETRAQVCKGLCSLIPAKPKQLALPLGLPKAENPVREMSNAEIAAMIDQVGVDRLLEIAAAREASL